VLTALDQLRETKAKRALVSLCIGGGQGGAAILERV
jgi:acetyl-CoA C-acetyltransferase/acetyl-CoA acyltransferase